jgi:peptide/nickel transport system substrate-binding protein
VRALRTTQAIRWASALVVLTLVAVACDGDTATTTTGGATTEATSAPTTEAVTTTAADECPDVFCVRYHIRPEAAWADGVPVTSDDFVFTYETVADLELEISNRRGYNQITGYEVIDDKTVVFAFGAIYAPWQTLFSIVLPEHTLRDGQFNSIWDEAITMGSGPFAFSEWAPDEKIVLQRNLNYWGDASGDVQTVELVFLEEPEAQVDALAREEIDMIYPQPQVSLVAEVDGIDGVEWEGGLDSTWEHIDFNQDDTRLQNLWIRQAIAQGIDRDAIVEALVRPFAPDAEPLGNSVWMNGSANYEDHFNERFPYDPAGAEKLLVDNGCIKGEDGIYECGGQRMSFTWTATAGNDARSLQFEMAQADLQEIGIELSAKFAPASEVFADANIFGDAGAWQIMNFAWIGSLDPAGQNTLYYCEGEASNGFGELNNLRYCDEEVDALIRSTDGMVDPIERAATYNQADELWLAGIPMIPLYQKPTLFAWNSVIVGPQSSATHVGPFWNIGDWTGKETVIYGADEQPLSLNTFEPDGNRFAAGLVSSAVLEGAFSITPDSRYEPRLVSSAETILPED